MNVWSGNPAPHSDCWHYVLAHEIAHILEGVMCHSATGIMKAQWGGRDYFDMAHNTLVFTSDDVKSIQHGIDLRAALENR